MKARFFRKKLNEVGSLKRFVLKVCVLLVISSVCVGKYIGTVDADNSVINWSGEKKPGAKPFGVVKIVQGQRVEFNDGIPVSGEIKIDMSTVFDQDLEEKSSLYEKVVNHLKEDALFSVKGYPHAVLKILNSKKTTLNKVEILTELTIKKETKPLKLTLDMTEQQKGFRCKSKFSLNRKKWNLTYGTNWFDRKLDRIIRDIIYFEIDILIVFSDPLLIEETRLIL
jgi:hypothetical protein